MNLVLEFCLAAEHSCGNVLILFIILLQRITIFAAALRIRLPNTMYVEKIGSSREQKQWNTEGRHTFKVVSTTSRFGKKVL